MARFENRSQGILTSVRSSLTSQAPSDRILIERVRSKLGTVVKHPRSIDLCSEGGRVIVAGPILAHEVGGLLQTIRNVSGPDEGRDQRQKHASSDSCSRIMWLWCSV